MRVALSVVLLGILTACSGPSSYRESRDHQRALAEQCRQNGYQVGESRSIWGTPYAWNRDDLERCQDQMAKDEACADRGAPKGSRNYAACRQKVEEEQAMRALMFMQMMPPVQPAVRTTCFPLGSGMVSCASQ